MLFNSFEFLVFFPVVTLMYFLLPHKYRWLHLLLASCYFYMSFVPVYILILFATIIVDYFAALLIHNASAKKRKWLFVFTVVINVLILCVFKYYNFFVENANTILDSIGYKRFDLPFLDILLPLGLSFHTFQALSYVIEVKRGNVKPEKHFGIYALYVMFYPQLVAGPIERPQNMLHQFHEEKRFDSTRVLIGIKIMLWGFVKKIVIADRLALYVNEIHGHPAHANSPQLWLAIFVFFPVQLYCDFSGYSSIALGSAKVMGFELMDNFKRPFSSLTTSEFWNRWHISLSTWLRDYIYQPLVIYFRNYGKWSVVIGLMITFIISGVWHGAGWKFIIYGIMQGSIITAEFLLGIKTTKLAKSSKGRFLGRVTTIGLWALSLVFFRAEGLHNALLILKKMFWALDFSYQPQKVAELTYILSIISIIGLIYFEKNHAEKIIYKQHHFNKEAVLNAGMILAIAVFGVFHNLSFIYFQF